LSANSAAAIETIHTKYPAAGVACSARNTTQHAPNITSRAIRRTATVRAYGSRSASAQVTTNSGLIKPLTSIARYSPNQGLVTRAGFAIAVSEIQAACHPRSFTSPPVAGRK